MKKIILVALLLLTFASVSNASVNGFIDGHPIVKVIYNGEELIPDGTPAMIYNNYTLVPVGVLRQLGFTVTWSQETYSVTLVPPPPVIKEVMVDQTGTPIVVPDSGTPPLDAEGQTTVPTSTPPPTNAPTATPTPTPAPNYAGYNAAVAALEASVAAANNQLYLNWYNQYHQYEGTLTAEAAYNNMQYNINQNNAQLELDKQALKAQYNIP